MRKKRVYTKRNTSGVEANGNPETRTKRAYTRRKRVDTTVTSPDFTIAVMTVASALATMPTNDREKIVNFLSQTNW